MTFMSSGRRRDRPADALRIARATSRVAKISPALLALGIFLAVALLFTGVLTLPFAANDGRSTPIHDAMFTAFSAVTVTGLVSVDTAEHWSFFGQAVILLGIQIGGLGIVTIALLLSRAVTRSLGVQVRIFAQQGIGTNKLGEVQSLLRIVVLTTLVLELALAAVLVPCFIIAEQSWPQGLWHGIFYAVSSFNNAGSLERRGHRSIRRRPLGARSGHGRSTGGELRLPGLPRVHHRPQSLAPAGRCTRSSHSRRRPCCLFSERSPGVDSNGRTRRPSVACRPQTRSSMRFSRRS